MDDRVEQEPLPGAKLAAYDMSPRAKKKYFKKIGLRRDITCEGFKLTTATATKKSQI